LFTQNRYVAYFLLAAVALTAGYFLRSQYTRSNPERQYREIQENTEEVLKAIEREAAMLLPDSVSGKSRRWDEVKHVFLQVDSNGIASWNGSDYVPNVGTFHAPDEFLFLSNQRGDLLIRKWKKAGGYLVNVLTLRSRYPIANGFLMPSQNEQIFPAREVEVTGPAASEGEAIGYKGVTLFRVVPAAPDIRDSTFSFLALFLALILLGASINGARHKLEVKWGADITLLLLIATLYGVRQLMVRTGIPALYFQSDIFDPRVFASSTINATMGDLLLNSICVLLLVLYLLRQYTTLRSVRWLLQQGVGVRYASGWVLLFLALLAVLFSFNFIEVIYHNSAQTLDITHSVDFSWVRVTAILSVMIGTISAFLFVHITTSLARHLIPAGILPFTMVLAAAVLLFWWQAALTGNDNRISLVLGLMMLLGLRVFRFDHMELTFSFRVLLYLTFSLTLLSIHHSLAIRGFHQERLVRDQFRYAKDFLAERDVLGEYLLDRVRDRISQDPFIQTRMASPFFSRSSVVEKIRRVHLNRYFDRYELSVGVRVPMDSTDRLPASWQPTGYSGVFYSSASTGDALKRYHVSIPIYHQRPVGSVELDLVLKRVLPDNVFPELLVDNRFSQLYRNRDFSYAVYNNGQVLNSFGSFQYERDFPRTLLSNPRLYNEGLSESGYYHVAIEEVDNSIAVVSSRDYTTAALVTNMCFWFVLGLVVLLCMQGIVGLVAVLLGHHFAYAARIQLFMFLAFALPMVVVSVTTLTLMSQSDAEKTTREFLERSSAAAQRLSAQLAQEGELGIDWLETWAVENTTYVQTDISVYAPSGRLIATSQPGLFDNQLLSTMINRKAYRTIVIDMERHSVSDERIGSLTYSSAYAAVLSPLSGKLQAIISLPFFESASYLQREQARVLSTILRVFVAVFIVFTLLSFFAADSLAKPIRLIARALRQTTLSGENKPLPWAARDEMGMLIQEYNRMVSNLDESKRALAQSEKESAWREMAKQVAHEIKNPLTPMKLTLQQMESDTDPNAEKTRKSVEVMLRQVEILDAIASSFSSLARMPALAPQQTDLVALVAQATALFANASEGKVQFSPPSGSFWVSVDPTALTRALSNIVINALQARAEGSNASVEITLTVVEKRAIIAIRDNGKGIPDSVQERIFQPQFTTKESGSGLGLYMARQFVLQSGGRIWFTTSGAGTTFFIELPLYSP